MLIRYEYEGYTNRLIALFFSFGIQVSIKLRIDSNQQVFDYDVSVPKSYAGRTFGLLGNFDGDQMNEFYIRGESTPLPYDILNTYESDLLISEDLYSCKEIYNILQPCLYLNVGAYPIMLYLVNPLPHLKICRCE